MRTPLPLRDVLRAPTEHSTDTPERVRRRLFMLVMVVYLLAIFEGSLRKYVFPQFGQYIFFIRDPFLVIVYVYAWRHGLWPRQHLLCVLAWSMCALGLLLFALQAMTGGPSEYRLLLGAYGWRSYFFYVPLAVIVGWQFRRAEIMRVVWVTLFLAIPIGVLVGVQFSSPGDAMVNVGTAEDTDLQFKGMHLTGTHIRPAGTFTSNAGQQQFVTTAFALLIAVLLASGPRRLLPLLVTLGGAAGILTCVALGGSRGTMLQCGLSGVFAVALGLLGRGAALKTKAVVLPLVIVVAAAVLYPIVFPQGFDAFMVRWNEADSLESRNFELGVFGRALYGFIDFIRLVETAPPLGYGLGFGGNASIILNATVDGVQPGRMVETDYARHMVDLGPPLGMAFIAFRFALVFWIGRLVLAATRRVPDPLPMMLFSYVMYVLLLGQIAGNGTINVYGWFFTGLCIAAARDALSSSSQPRPAVAAQSVRPRRELSRSNAPRGIPPRTRVHTGPALLDRKLQTK
jgi:hypothetical protein